MKLADAGPKAASQARPSPDASADMMADRPLRPHRSRSGMARAVAAHGHDSLMPEYTKWG